jgi:murein DD-endopeptidase MepM/ murein hydrolase activator NlpD
VPAPVPVEGTFRRGETLAGVFQEIGLDSSDALLAVSALSQHLDVRKVRAGDGYAALYGIDTHRIESLEVPVPGVGRAVAVRRGDGWEGRFQPFERRLVPLTVSGVVEGSLISAVAAAGATPQLAYRMADVLQWDLDFSRDLRRGDTFEVAFDAVELDGRPAGLGDIWALTFDNGGRRLEAYRYGGDYYDGEGQPLKKMFLRSPLQYAFVTSSFNPRRLHPVLKTYRPHWGVDYRAKVGTPVRVTASGVVTFAGWSNGGGKMVKVRHPNGYVTAYLHLSRFASGMRPGARVRQGDVVAYSGNTGLSTAPHLDYRVQRDGRWLNPLQLDNVPAEPIPADQLAGFLAFRDTCRRSLADGAPLPLRPQEDADGGVQMASLSGAETPRTAAGPATSGR